MEQKVYKLPIGGRVLEVKPFEFADQASGSATISMGETVVLATATMSDSAREGIDFFPLVVDFEENHFAAGKIKGSKFVKRAGRPSEKAILTSRLIDRPVRPLFPYGMTNEVQIICSTMSIDADGDAAILALNGASVALCISGMPFQGPIGAVRIGMVNDQLVLNPTPAQIAEGKLDLVVAGTLDAITMVECESKEVTDEKMLEALAFAHESIKEICKFQQQIAAECSREALEYKLAEKDDTALEMLKTFVTSEMLDSVKGVTKKEVKKSVKAVQEQVLAHFEAAIAEEKISASALKSALNEMLEERMRENILQKEIRIDGRALDEVRPITCRVGVFPATHGTGMFQRGETQIVSVCTLGAPGDAQVMESMDEEFEKRYLHHYIFPPYSTGEVKPMRGPSRREIGHGYLAERALNSMIPPKEEFPYTIWVSSQVFGCNGSSSMGSVCGSTLSLMHAGVPIKRPVSGIAMGLVTDGSGNYKILADIQGLEDFAGDMDFKVAGTTEGITALQMDIKVEGLSIELLRDALQKANKARMHVLDEMLKTISAPNPISSRAPMITQVVISPEQIPVLIGKGGETIQKITKECGVSIDIEQSGLVAITAPDQESGNKALEWVKRITYEPKAGDIIEGKVVKIADFGAFVELAPGKDGLLHISEISSERVARVEDVLKVGDLVKVKVMSVDDKGRLSLSKKALGNS
jgi:polyribonucleotide nucleotidyltransferase